MKILPILIASVIIFSACKPEERMIEAPQTSWQILAATDMPAALKIIEQPGSKVITDDAYAAANGEAMPAVTKIAEYGGRLFLLKKDAPEIEVLDRATFKKSVTIEMSSAGTPIDITFPNATTAFVIHANTEIVDVVDIYNNKVARSIAVGKKPVAVAAVGNQVYIANQDDNTLSVIDTRTNLVTMTLPVHTAPMALAAHPSQNEVLVLSLGGGKLLKEGEEKSPARLTFINNDTKQTINSVSVFEVAKDSLLGVPVGLALGQGSYPYAFVAFKTVITRVDARRHAGTRILRQPASAGIQYNFKRDELLIFNTNGNSLQLITANPVSGDKRMTTTLPFSPTVIIPF
ncbi:MAG TPA: YncE family protein [Patescibacteria group bacterium]|nr:YncE family protein [Patescibacteria group bacterium]